ncbi:MAG: DNA repair protein RecN [Clostridia bacterium]|nr:DNA repair protein RecN [Clostridia bacterium]
MLQSLHIENIAVIKTLDIDFENGFSVLTGETGAGKSIIIDSINMLSGNRISRELIRSGEDKALVSAVFCELSENVKRLLEEYGFETEDSLMLQRTLSKDGKSIVKLNGRTVTQAIQKDICRLLINIHGQNENQRLVNKGAQLDILDAFAENGELLSEYSDVYKQLSEAKSKLDELNSNQAEKMRMRDVYAFQMEEINAVKLKDGEEDILEAERNRLGSIEKISEKVNLVYRALYAGEKGSAVYLLERSAAALDKISDVLPEVRELSQRLNDYRYEIEDIALTVRDYAADAENPTEQLNKIESRLDAINKLKRKYGNTVAEILEFRDKTAKMLDEIDNSDDIKEDISNEIKRVGKIAIELAEKIHDRRASAAEKITVGVMENLKFLDMPKVKFRLAVNSGTKLRNDGLDDVEFLIATNAGEPLMPLEKIASGGELSRIMLALKCVLSDKDGVGTVIYDEVDAGISGKTSRKVGIKLKEISEFMQIISVTHSAQIASLADNHYLISKQDVDGRTESSVDLLDEKGRVNEIARILGGINVTESQMTAAREMIEEGRSY